MPHVRVAVCGVRQHQIGAAAFGDYPAIFEP
jgi:hypothetical protein